MGPLVLHVCVHSFGMKYSFCKLKIRFYQYELVTSCCICFMFYYMTAVLHYLVFFPAFP